LLKCYIHDNAQCYVLPLCGPFAGFFSPHLALLCYELYGIQPIVMPPVFTDIHGNVTFDYVVDGY